MDDNPKLKISTITPPDPTYWMALVELKKVMKSSKYANHSVEGNAVEKLN